MTDYIYSRVSTEEQRTDAQLMRLTRTYPNARVVSEVASGAKKRPLLNALVKQLKRGDRLIVYSLDRLGRRTLDLLELIEGLEEKGVVVKSIREGVDYSTPVGKLVTQILASVAEMERNLISERTKTGLAAARAQGKFGGRPETIPRELKGRAISAVKGGLSIRKAARIYKISPGYLSVLVRAHPEAN